MTFQSNGGSGVAPAEVLRGTPLAPPQAPTRSGYRFTGWLNAAGERVELLPASAFFAKTADGETDWRTTVPVTLTAEWEKA